MWRRWSAGFVMHSAHRSSAVRAVITGSMTALLENEPDAEWAFQARLQLVRLVRSIRLIYAEAALSVGESDAARQAAEKALSADALDESACRALIRALHREGEPAAALAVYQQLRAVLDVELGGTPAPETRVAGECELSTKGESVGCETLYRAAALAEQHGMPGVARRAREQLARLSTR